MGEGWCKSGGVEVQGVGSLVCKFCGENPLCPRWSPS